MRHWLDPRHLAPLAEEALIALNANRLRSALTTLGVVIGVASVILMLAIGEGSRRRVAQTIASLGSNQLIVVSGAPSSGGFRGSAGGLPNLTLEDTAAIGELYSVRGVAPVANSSAQAVYGARNKSTGITGTTPAYFAVNNMTIIAGAAFTDADVRTAANVALLGATVVRELFGEESPVGKTLRIQRQTFQVIGVLKPKGQGFGGQDQDDVIVLPVTTAQRKLSGTVFPGSVSTVIVESRFAEQKGYTQQEVARLLRQRHRIAPGAEDDFTLRDLSALTETLRLTSTIVSVLIGSIAFISLLVGGIGIMNIMLVSVTERTREIGVRMAVGARRASVLGQFLIEAVLLSFAGALIGLALGFGTGWLVSRTGVVTAVFSSTSVALALSVAIGVGIGFGYWPARRAAQLQPVDALRYQ
jgi:putative ABC transport system permease protein